MTDDVADHVYPILLLGLSLQERLDRGGEIDIAQEQARLINLLNAEGGKQLADFVGESSNQSDSSVVSRHESTSGDSRQYLGTRYALVCWLDELFSETQSGGAAWKNRSLETALFGSSHGSWKFWEQAHLAEGRGADAVE